MLCRNSSLGHTRLSLLHPPSLLPRSHRLGARCLQRYRLLCAYTSKYWYCCTVSSSHIVTSKEWDKSNFYGPIKILSNAPSQIWLDGSRDHQPCIFKMLVARSRTEDRSLSSTSSFTHTFIRQILHQLITFILILLSSISITQFR